MPALSRPGAVNVVPCKSVELAKRQPVPDHSRFFERRLRDPEKFGRSERVAILADLVGQVQQSALEIDFVPWKFSDLAAPATRQCEQPNRRHRVHRVRPLDLRVQRFRKAAEFTLGKKPLHRVRLWLLDAARRIVRAGAARKLEDAGRERDALRRRPEISAASVSSCTSPDLVRGSIRASNSRPVWRGQACLSPSVPNPAVGYILIHSLEEFWRYRKRRGRADRFCAEFPAIPCPPN